jgi:hypothetical protein
LNRYGWWKRQDGATCHQDRLIRQQLIEQLTREILNYDAEFRREDAAGAPASHATALGLAGDIEDRAPVAPHARDGVLYCAT